MKVYTKTGDKGTTCLIGGTRIAKSDLRIETYGTSDELNSFVGLLRSGNITPEIDAQLERIQNKLFNLGGYLALDQTKYQPTEATSVSEDDVRFLENAIDAMEAEVEEVHAFILPGGSETIARCHVCRTVCRRLERRMVALLPAHDDQNSYDRLALQFVNRLSDYLFILSKKIAKNEKKALFLWKN